MPRNILFFFLMVIYLLGEKERESACKLGRGREREREGGRKKGRERIPSWFQVVRAEPDVGLDLTNPETMT